MTAILVTSAIVDLCALACVLIWTRRHQRINAAMHRNVHALMANDTDCKCYGCCNSKSNKDEVHGAYLSAMREVSRRAGNFAR